MSSGLRNIVTGVSGNNNINVDNAKVIGEEILKKMPGQYSSELHFKQSDTVNTISGNISKTDLVNKVKPEDLFQRCVTIGSKLEIPTAELLKHELTQYPTSLFEASYILNDPNKTSFADALWNHIPPQVITIPVSCKYVLDGGALLYRVTWKRGSSFKSILHSYFSYIENKFCKHSMPVIIFDGYGGPSTTDSTHLRRSGGIEGPQVDFDLDTMLTLERRLFLSCSQNKSRFISFLGNHLQQMGCTVLYAEGDADYTIVNTAVEMSFTEEVIVLVMILIY